MHFFFANSPFEDNALIIEFLNQKNDLLFDLGNIFSFKPSQLSRIRWVVVTHTHLDHFSGFPFFLRHCIASGKREVEFFGPQDFARQFENAMHSYQWNLLEKLDIRFFVSEVRKRKIEQYVFDSQYKFKKQKLFSQHNDGILLEKEDFFLQATLLDHKIPVLACRLEWKPHWGIDKEKLTLLGLSSGKWLKEALILKKNNASKDTIVPEIELPLEKIDPIFYLKPSFSCAYLTDFGFTSSNIRKAIKLAHNVDILFVESKFLQKDESLALKHYHLTAYQAGILAAKSQAKKVYLFHFSDRYNGLTDLFYQEMEEGRRSVS